MIIKLSNTGNVYVNTDHVVAITENAGGGTNVWLDACAGQMVYHDSRSIYEVAVAMGYGGRCAGTRPGV